MRSAADLLHELNLVDESVRIEAKRGTEAGKSVMQTVIAFANEPGLDGGYLLLGVEWFTNDKGDTVYRPAGLSDPDKIQHELASQCSSMLNVALRPEMRVEMLDGRAVLVVYVPEADVTQKPVYFKATGLPRGAWRRVGSTDQQCVDDDLWVLRGEAQPLHGPDSSILPDADLDDFDPAALAAYRRERALVNPQAEELNYSDEDLLVALGALRRAENRRLCPTLAGIVLFGKPMALRRLLPALRIDYIRVPGTEWVEDPERRFQSIDIRKPLLLALPQAEASIVDELPRTFYLPEGQLQSVQSPLLPRKVIREALANVAMHRSYTVHQPSQIIRYGNRIEIRNAGYSLKDPEQLGTPGSRLRNPLIAAVLHDLHLAEAKGTGIRTMRRLSAEAGLPLPDLHSDRQANQFQLTLFLHNLLTEEDHAWLKQFTGAGCSKEEAQVLTYARATGAVDNAACRDVCGLDTLAASAVLRRLRDRGLLHKKGAGNRTYYVLDNAARPVGEAAEQQLPLMAQKQAADDGREAGAHASEGVDGLGPEVDGLGPEVDGLGPEVDGRGPEVDGSGPEVDGLAPEVEGGAARRNAKMVARGLMPDQYLSPLPPLPEDLASRLCDMGKGKRPPQGEVAAVIRALCLWHPMRLDQLAELLQRNGDHLRRAYLQPMLGEGQLRFRYPESPNHPLQAYIAASGDDDSCNL